MEVFSNSTYEGTINASFGEFVVIGDGLVEIYRVYLPGRSYETFCLRMMNYSQFLVLRCLVIFVLMSEVIGRAMRAFDIPSF